MSLSIAKTVRCQLCSEYYNDPRVLPCLHPFCCGCLQTLIKAASLGSEPSITCPTCQKNTPIPSKGSVGFPRNLRLAREAKTASLIQFLTSRDHELYCDGCSPERKSATKSSDVPTPERAMAFCCNCNELLCQLCWDHHRHHRRFCSHHIVSLERDVATQLTSSPYCSGLTCREVGHKGKVLSFYCSTCSDMVCCCCKIGGDHGDHSYRDVAEVAKEKRDRMSKVLESAHIKVTELTGAVDQCSGLMEKVEHTKMKAAAEINNAFDDLLRALEERRNTLLARVEEIMLSKSEALKLCVELLNDTKQEISKCSDLVSDVHWLYSDEEVVVMKDIFPDELQSIIDASETVPLRSNQHSDIAVTIVPAAIIASIKELGNVDDISAAKCTWKLKTPLIANVESRLEVEAKTSEDVRWACADLQVWVELESKGQDGEVVTGLVDSNGDGTYTVTLTPPTIGLYQLHVTVDGEDIDNSPCDVHVTHNYSSLKCTYQTFSSVSYSTTNVNCMVIYSERIYLSLWHKSNKHYYYCNISVYSLDGRLQQTIGSYGNGHDNFDDPHGIAIKGDTMYVADTDNDRIQKLTTSGEFLQSFGKGKLQKPKAIAISSEGKVLVANSTGKVQVFLPDSDVFETVTFAAPNESTNLYVYEIMVDGLNNIHVVSNSLNTVLVYSPEGRYIRKYGHWECESCWYRGVKLSKDNNGCSIVCCHDKDSYFSDVKVNIFDMFGNQICSLSTSCSHVAIDHCGNMYVATSGGLITKWSLL